MSSAFVDLLISQEGRGAGAVMQVLEQAGVARWDNAYQVWRFEEKAVSGEVLNREVERLLGRR